jgi:hypothetical protein
MNKGTVLQNRTKWFCGPDSGLKEFMRLRRLSNMRDNWQKYSILLRGIQLTHVLR